MTRTAIARALALLALAALCACGWRSGMDLPQGAGSVGVEIFGLVAESDDVPVRDLEPLMHEQLSRAVSDLVGAPLAASGEADVLVRGRLLGYRRRGGIRSPDNELLETGIRIVLEAELVRRASGEVLGRTQAQVWSGYVVGAPENELAARERALRHLAQRVVLDLFAEPSYGDAAPTSDAPDAALPTGLLRGS